MQEYGFAMKGEFVMVIYFMYSVLDHKCCIWIWSYIQFPKWKIYWLPFFPFLRLLNTILGLHIKLNVGYLGEYKKRWRRLNLRALITRFSYLSPSTTIKMLYKLWRKGIDAHSPKQMNVSKLVPIHRQRALSVNRYGIGESLLVPCLQKWQATSVHLVHTDNCRAQSPFIRPWCIVMMLVTAVALWKGHHFVSFGFAGT